MIHLPDEAVLNIDQVFLQMRRKFEHLRFVALIAARLEIGPVDILEIVDLRIQIFICLHVALFENAPLSLPTKGAHPFLFSTWRPYAAGEDHGSKVLCTAPRDIALAVWREIFDFAARKLML